MTQPDELQALEARVEEQRREIEEMRSENERLRAAQADATDEAEALRDELQRQAPSAGPSAPYGYDAPLGARFDGWKGPNAAPGRGLRAMGLLLGLTLLGSMMLSNAISLQARGPRGGLPMAADAVQPMVWTGTVVETTGPHVVAAGESCVIERHAVSLGGPFDCRVVVRCGEQTLYGADPRTGFLSCGGRELVEDRNTTRFDGDPAFRLDLPRGEVTVEERVGMATQTVRIQLSR